MDIRPFVGCMFLASVVFFPNYSFSQEGDAEPAPAAGEIFEVATPENVQNGGDGNVLDGGNTLLVTDDGSIDIITNHSATAVRVSAGAKNVIENAGRVSLTRLEGAGMVTLIEITPESADTVVENSGIMELTSGLGAGHSTGVHSVGVTGDLAVINSKNGKMMLFRQGGAYRDIAAGIRYQGSGDLTFTNAGTLSVRATDSWRAQAFIFEGKNLDVDISGTAIMEMSGAQDSASGFAGIRSGVNNADSPSHRNIDISGSVVLRAMESSTIYGVWNIAPNVTINISGSFIATSTSNAGTVYGIVTNNYPMTITNSGTISMKSMSTTGNNKVYGIYSKVIADDGVKAAITNSGIISATTIGPRSAAYGIYSEMGNVVAAGVQATATISNSGTISAESVSIIGAGRIYGIYSKVTADGAAGVQTTINNSGTISAESVSIIGAGRIYGIHYQVTAVGAAGAQATISNSGIISASTAGTGEVIGIYYKVSQAGVAGARETISNSGSITASTTGSGYVYGIYSEMGAAANGTGVRAIIRNSGVISGSTIGSGYVYGLFFSNGGSLVNSGTIIASSEVAAPGSAGAGGRGAITISNSGSIIGSVKSNIAAIHLGGDGSLEFGKGTFIVGRMLLRGDTSISIDGDQPRSLHYVFGGAGVIEGGKPQVSGLSPAFYSENGREVAILDTRYLDAGIDALEGMTRNVSGLTRSRRFVQDISKSHVWISGAVSRRANGKNDGFFALNNGDRSLTAGIDGSFSAGFSVGGLVGTNVGRMVVPADNASSSYESSTVDLFGAVHAIQRFDHVFVQTAVSGGILKHNDLRFIQDNTVGSGIDIARSSYHSYWYSPEVTLGVGISAFDWTYTPSVNLRYTRQLVEAYGEECSISNVNYDRRSISLFSGRAGLAVDRQFAFTHLTLRAGFQSFGLIGRNNVSLGMLDGPKQTFVIQSGHKKGVYGGVDIALQLSQNASVALGGEAIFSKDKKVNTHLSAGLDIAF